MQLVAGERRAHGLGVAAIAAHAVILTFVQPPHSLIHTIIASVRLLLGVFLFDLNMRGRRKGDGRRARAVPPPPPAAAARDQFM
jgi:hypothetical protein